MASDSSTQRGAQAVVDGDHVTVDGRIRERGSRMLSMRLALLAAVLALSSGCALPTRRFVDPDGRPIEGVLVFSYLPGDMLFGGAKVTAFLTDSEGCAPVASPSDVLAIGPGYHTWTSGGYADWGRSTEASDRQNVVMHRRSGAAQPEVHVSLQELFFTSAADETQAIELPPELGVILECVDRTGFRVRARAGQVLQSQRFYFAGPSPGSWVSSLRQEDDLFFYVRTPAARFYKVGVTRAHRAKITARRDVGGVMRQVPAESVTLLWADLREGCPVLEPEVAPERPPWPEWAQLIVGPDPERIADEVQAALRRGDLEDSECAQLWLSKLHDLDVEEAAGR